MSAPLEFVECARCAAKPGSPTLCRECLHNRNVIHLLQRTQRSPRPVGAAAAGPERLPWARALLVRAGGVFLGLVRAALFAFAIGIFLPIGIHAGRVITLAACSSVFGIGVFKDGQ
jgi:hypothetical protein